jgi:hypothetical protein
MAVRQRDRALSWRRHADGEQGAPEHDPVVSSLKLFVDQAMPTA